MENTDIYRDNVMENTDIYSDNNKNGSVDNTSNVFKTNNYDKFNYLKQKLDNLEQANTISKNQYATAYKLLKANQYNLNRSKYDVFDNFVKNPTDSELTNLETFLKRPETPETQESEKQKPNNISIDDINNKLKELIDKKKINKNMYNNALKSIKSLSMFIQKDSFLMSMIDQIDINKQNQFELIPKMGKQQIYFGDTSDMKEKFERFTLFYKKVIPKYGWDKYSKVNLQYRDQVVASIKGIEDIKADSMRALQIMKAVAEYSEKSANDTSRSLLSDNASNSTDISFIMQSLQRDEVDSDTAISVNASAKKTNIIINKEIVNKTKKSPEKNSIKSKPSTQKK
jgi:ribosomal protein L19E